MIWIACVAALCILFVQAQNIQFKLDKNWTLTSRALNIQIHNLDLPVSVHTALLGEKLIGDPLFRFNDLNLTWIFQNDDWVFSNHFRVEKFTTPNDSSKINFIFDSIDTIASVYLNGRFLLSTNNQFMRYQAESLNSQLNGDLNLIELFFSSPTQVASSLAWLYPYREPPSNFNR